MIKGNFSSLAQFSQDLRRLPRELAGKVTTAAAPEITKLAKASFNASEDPYGNPWLPSADGHTVTLRKKGNLEKFLHYVAIGTKLRVALGVPYAKYQIGKRPVFPRQGGALPDSYVQTLQRVAADIVRRFRGPQ